MTGENVPELVSYPADAQSPDEDEDSVYSERFDTAEQQSITYRTPTTQDRLLWPGFSLYCWWEFTAAPRT